jgi:hypothetical protein
MHATVYLGTALETGAHPAKRLPWLTINRGAAFATGLKEGHRDRGPGGDPHRSPVDRNEYELGQLIHPGKA